MTTASVAGTTGEDRSDYTAEESRAIRRRSLRLLGSLAAPVRWQLVLAGVVLVISTALRVAGPALIAVGLNEALPKVIDEGDWMPTIVIVAVYLVAGIGGAALIGWYAVVAARLTQAIMLDLRKRIFVHRPSTVTLADRVALLDEGRITAVGRHSDLLRQSAHYRHVISSLEEAERDGTDLRSDRPGAPPRESMADPEMTSEEVAR